MAFKFSKTICSWFTRSNNNLLSIKVQTQIQYVAWSTPNQPLQSRISFKNNFHCVPSQFAAIKIRKNSISLCHIDSTPHTNVSFRFNKVTAFGIMFIHSAFKDKPYSTVVKFEQFMCCSVQSGDIVTWCFCYFRVIVFALTSLRGVRLWSVLLLNIVCYIVFDVCVKRIFFLITFCVTFYKWSRVQHSEKNIYWRRRWNIYFIHYR